MPHETPEAISALYDGELAVTDAARVQAHLASCAECAETSRKLRVASAAFKRSGRHAMPPAIAARVKAEAAPAKGPSLKLAFAFAVGLVAILASGVVLKTFMPTLFNNIQQMITGAAGQMGSGGK